MAVARRPDRRQQLVGRADARSQTELDGALGVDPLGREQDLGRALPADHVGQQKRAAGLGDHAERDERRAQPRALGHVHDVAVQQEREPDADADSVHGGEQRLVEA